MLTFTSTLCLIVVINSRLSIFLELVDIQMTAYSCILLTCWPNILDWIYLNHTHAQIM